MSAAATRERLTAAGKRLVELMQTVGFGRVEGLEVRAGEPVFDPPPIVVREVRFGGENGPRRELGLADFALKSQVVELFGCLCRLGDGVVRRLEIKHGLPFRMDLEGTAGM